MTAFLIGVIVWSVCCGCVGFGLSEFLHRRPKAAGDNEFVPMNRVRR